MSSASRPAMPTVPPRQGAFRARRDWFLRGVATWISVFTAAFAVLIVAAAAVAFAIA